MSSWTPAKAQDELNKLIDNNEVQYIYGYLGVVKNYYVTSPNHNHKYLYNRNKIISKKIV